MSRRAFLRLMGGAGAAAASGVTAKQAAQALGMEDGLTVGSPVAASLQEGAGNAIGMDGPHRIMQMLWRARDAHERPTEQLPPHIATKRSWSPAFKTAVYQQERAIMDAFEQKLHQDHEFMKSAAAFLGVKV